MTRAGLALVTGSAGFVGRHMVRELEMRGWDVDGWDIVDGLDARLAFSGTADYRFDLVVHCAAQAPHRAAIDGQPRTFAYNVALDAAMFDWAARTRQRRVIYFSSSAVYPVGYQRGEPAYRLQEDDAFGVGNTAISSDLLRILAQADRRMVDLEPDGRYGATKLVGEQMAEATRAAGVPVHVLRPFSGYGEDQAEEWPFGAFLARAARREDPFTMWNGSAVRDWIHISDVVAGALAVAEHEIQQAVNLCTGRAVSALDLASMICERMGHRPTVEQDGGAPQGVAYRVGDPGRMLAVHNRLVSLEEGVERAVRRVRGEVVRG